MRTRSDESDLEQFANQLTPLCAVGEDADVPLPGLPLPLADVPGQLLRGGRHHGGRPQVPLDFDDAEPDLDVDPAPVADLRLKLDVLSCSTKPRLPDSRS